MGNRRYTAIAAVALVAMVRRREHSYLIAHQSRFRRHRLSVRSAHRAMFSKDPYLASLSWRDRRCPASEFSRILACEARRRIRHQAWFD